jgi:hypothetical protein
MVLFASCRCAALGSKATSPPTSIGLASGVVDLQSAGHRGASWNRASGAAAGCETDPSGASHDRGRVAAVPFRSDGPPPCPSAPSLPGCVAAPPGPGRGTYGGRCGPRQRPCPSSSPLRLLVGRSFERRAGPGWVEMPSPVTPAMLVQVGAVWGVRSGHATVLVGGAPPGCSGPALARWR